MIKKTDKLYSILGLNRSNNSYNMYDPSKKALFHKENFSSFLKGNYFDVQPVCVEIVPSLDCNFNCPKCTYVQNKSKEKDKGKKRLMSQEVFDSIIGGLKGSYIKSLIFTGGGEPLKNPLYLEFMKQAKESGFEIGLYTNGALFKEGDFEKLLEIKPVFIRVSLNAGTSITHGLIYGYNGKNPIIFNNIKRNIVDLGRTKTKLNVPTNIGIGYIINEKNYEELDEISDVLLQLYEDSEGGIDYVAFRPEVYYFDDDLNVVTEQPNSEIFAEIPDLLEDKIANKVESSGMRVLINKEGFNNLSLPYQNIPNISHPWSASFDYDGRMYITSEHNGMEGFCIGDIKNTSLKDVWYGNKRKELMMKMDSGEIKTPPYFKLKSLNNLLLNIRDLGIFSEKEANEFYKSIDIDNKPPHVNFI
ncbi:radical SAM protein [Candidatus Woesearchaeota archaeon]|nr:radical SAM protein [Candidatus Woesearchaeota archaeon]